VRAEPALCPQGDAALAAGGDFGSRHRHASVGGTCQARGLKIRSESLEAVVAMINWPIPYAPGPNAFEVVGRYIAQTVQMERFIDMILLEQGAKPRDLKRAKLSRKIEDVRAVVQRPESELNEWSDLPDMMVKVAQNRNLFAHRMFEPMRVSGPSATCGSRRHRSRWARGRSAHHRCW